MSVPDRDDEITRDYLAAFVAVERPSSASARATWAAIDRRTTRRPPVARWTAIVVLVAAAVLLFAIVDWRELAAPTREDAPTQAPYEGAPSTAGGEARDREQPAPAHVRETPREAPIVTPEPAPSSAGDAGAAAPLPTDETGGEAHERPRRASKRDNAQPAPTVATGPSALAEETALLGEIQTAIVAGRPNDALGKVAAHRKRFPRGAYTHEVTVAKANALCALGQTEQSRAVAETFVKRHPTSHLVARAKGICRP